MKEGTEKEAKGDFAGAYFKLKDARDLFDAAGEADRTWQPEIVEYRRRKIREEMERVRKLEVQRRAAGGPVSASGVIGNASAPNLSIEPALPAGTAPATPRNTPLVMEERLRGMQAQIDALTKKNEETLQKLGSRDNELFAARGEILTARNAEKALRESLAKVQTDLDRAEPMAKRENKNLTKRVEQLEQQLGEAMTQLSTANAKSDSLLADLEKAYGEVKERTRERDELRKERDQFEALLSGGDGGKAPEKMKIIAENQRLKKELEAAQVTVAKLTAEKTSDQNEIATLRGQLEGMQEQVARFQQESDDYRQQIVTLTERLDATNRMLGEKGEGAVNEVEASLENKVLREIILQQMKQQAKREAARRNIMEDLTKDGVLDSLKNLGVETDRVLRTLNEMAAAPDMAKEQRAVLSTSRLNEYLLNNGGPDLMMVQDSQALKDDGTPAAPNGTPQGESKSKEQLAPELKAYANAAEELFVRNAFTEAENQYRKILLVEPMNVHALSNLGVVQVKQGNYDEALKTIMKALAYDYDRGPVHYLLGVVHLRLNQPEEAAKEMKVALELDPTNSNAHLTLGRIAWNAKRHAEAEQHLKQAIALDPANAYAHFNLAVIYASDEKIDLARQHYRLARRHGAARDEKLDNLLGS
ncbi:MAG: lipoprotein NlpI [Verrucomicrobiales bacterium]|nr:lipoprotein NlpI [Verrucomicrobiales bacterium]